MTTVNAIKKLEKLGFGKVQHNDNRQYWLDLNLQRISFIDQGGEAICIHTQRVTEQADLQSDYFPGSFWDNMAQAIRHTLPYVNEKMCACGLYVADADGSCQPCKYAAQKVAVGQ